ncbi:hypothetical protein [Acinetobacter baumannii]|uniref:hypothetical protein n=1 Tax=Acinetobacter baumannii TaxID=470 RepID=UPI003AF72612
MDKCREEFESSLERTDGFHDGYVTWNEASGMYMANDDDYECMADWMNGAFAIHRKMQAKVEELQTLYTQQGINMFKLQKRVDALEKAEFTLARIRSIVRKNLLESILIKEVRQALKGEG